MATRKKAATVEGAAGLKQKSLLFFFSKPSACPPSQKAPSQLQQALHGEEDSHSSSYSSYQEDRGDSLRWSQLLTGWSSAQGVPSLHSDNDPVDHKHGGSEDHDIDPEEIKEKRKTQNPLSTYDEEEQDDRKSPLPLSAFADDKNEIYGGDAAPDLFDKESQLSLILCKRRRTQTSRYRSYSSLNADKKFHTETGSYVICSPSAKVGKIICTGAAFCGGAIKASEVAEADHLNLPISLPNMLGDEVCQPLLPSQNGRMVCAHSTYNKSSVEQPELVVMEMKYVEASPSLPDVEHSRAHGEAGPALNPELDVHKPEHDFNVCGLTEARRLHSVDMNICHSKREPEKVSRPESDSSHDQDELEAHDDRDKVGHCKLLKRKGYSGRADLGMYNIENGEATYNKCTVEQPDLVFAETKFVKASPSPPDIEHSRAHGEAGPALNPELDVHEVEHDINACRLTEARWLHSVDMNICHSNGEPEKVSLSESNGSHGQNKLEAHDDRDKTGHCKLVKRKDDSGNADLGMVNIENSAGATKAPKMIMDESKTGFLKLKRGSGHRVSAPEEVSEAPITEYEREREENILRNQHFLQKLGISSSALAINKESSNHSSVKPRGKAVFKVKPPVLPTRRSSRLLPNVAAIQLVTAEGTVEATAHAATKEEEHLFYDDSSVLRYTCELVVRNGEPHPSHGFTAGVNSIIGFQPLDGVLQDTYLTRIYTMSACFVSHSRRTLLAAGGHQGQIAVFGTSVLDRYGKTGATVTSMDIENDVCWGSGSLLAWKGSSGWISGVKFLSTQTQENANLLLSSANDGNLVLWDISKQQRAQHPTARLAGLPPMKVTEARDIHSNGIFSMHEFSGHVLTASKDSTVGYSKITNQEIVMERSISGHHSGAIRGVNCRDASVIADCGGDGLICVLDLRMADPCALTIDTTDSTGVNVVEWCPSQDHLLLSASKNPQITLHDVRSIKEPLHRLSGHVNPNVHRCSQIYRPAFVAQGLAIASPGQGSKALSLYCVQTGKAISRGHLGYDASMVMWTASNNDSPSVLWVASRHISQLLPLWQT